MQSVVIPYADLNGHLRAYRAQPLREYSHSRRHVYYIPSTRMYITVRSAGAGNVELEFTSECPCTYND